ncbi:hypothetical protein GGS26DRAFT_593564 [Hypomontagnella submonticulosa]|nr:hypothetical protein GGS26DRAFT_593564 [Hypomontagnella submonticulosa]
MKLTNILSLFAAQVALTAAAPVDSGLDSINPIEEREIQRRFNSGVSILWKFVGTTQLVVEVIGVADLAGSAAGQLFDIFTEATRGEAISKAVAQSITTAVTAKLNANGIPPPIFGPSMNAMWVAAAQNVAANWVAKASADAAYTVSAVWSITDGSTNVKNLFGQNPNVLLNSIAGAIGSGVQITIAQSNSIHTRSLQTVDESSLSRRQGPDPNTVCLNPQSLNGLLSNRAPSEPDHTGRGCPIH